MVNHTRRKQHKGPPTKSRPKKPKLKNYVRNCYRCNKYFVADSHSCTVCGNCMVGSRKTFQETFELAEDGSLRPGITEEMARDWPEKPNKEAKE